MNKWKIVSVVLLALALKAKAAPGSTNNAYSKTNIDYMLSTNRTYVSNVTWVAATVYSSSNTTFAVSNLQWMVFTNGATTNFPVLAPGSNVVWMRFTNGISKGMTNAAP
jgi:hypothetical protein